MGRKTLTIPKEVYEDRYDRAPAFMGEFRESFLKTSPSTLTQLFQPGETVKICLDCSEALFLADKVAICHRCAFSENAADFPPGLEECPSCGELDSLTFRGGDNDD